jgi:hypothetical protein
LAPQRKTLMYPPTLAPPPQTPPMGPDPLMGAGAGPVDPASMALAPPPTPEPLTLPPLTDDQRGAIKSWFTASDQESERYASLWKKNLDAYAPQPETAAKDREDYEVNTNVDFRQAEQKKAQLWFDTAQVQLTPTEPLSDLVLSTMPLPDGSSKEQQLSAAISLHQTVLNQILSPDGVNAKRTIQAAILDVLVPAGWGVTHIGYTAYTKDVPTVDPMTGMPTIAKVPVYEEFFWSRLSPKMLMVPADFRSTDFDKAPWLAIKFKIPLSAARREYGHAIPDGYKGAVKDDPSPMREENRSTSGGQGPGASFDPYVSGIQMYYYEPTLNPNAFHPKRVCECVFLQGLDQEVRHRYIPYQSLDAEGRLTGDSMPGYPIHVLMLRDVPDDNHVPSDSAMTRPLTDELNQYRGQILKSRDASIPYSFYDEDILPPEKIERITNGKYGPMIPVEGGRLNAATPPVMPGNKPQLSQETYTGQEIIERDIDRTLALGPNQSGVQNQSRRTATEVATMQSSLDTRLAGEQQAVVAFFCAGVRKLDALVQRFSDRKQVTQILGEDGNKLWISWNKEQIAGRFAYTIKPDSQIHVDAAQDRQQDLAFYNLTARDPFINRLELARRLALKWGFNPDKLVQPPPPQGPPKPNVQVRIQAQDLDPRLPQFPFAIEILQQSGYQISPDALQNSVILAGKATAQGSLPDDITPPKDSGLPKPQPEHPGAAEQTEPISKHAADRTGALPGGGSPFAQTPS